MDDVAFGIAEVAHAHAWPGPERTPDQATALLGVAFGVRQTVDREEGLDRLRLPRLGRCADLDVRGVGRCF